MEISASGQACGASIRGVDLTQALSDKEVADIRAAWLEHHVLCFPDQLMSDDDLERFSLYFGQFGDDPFIAPIAGRSNVISVQREADETLPLFADNWHTDWSFQAIPPDGTCLFGIDIPPQGGDTCFVNQHLAWDEMPDELRSKVAGLKAIHSAELAYAPTGAFGDADRDAGRSMDIRPSESARERRIHPLIRKHPESGRDAIYSCIGYIVGIDGMEDEDAVALLFELHEWQTQERFEYRHKWQANSLVMWDNRSVLHKATGGYEGHRRELHRTTIAGTRF